MYVHSIRPDSGRNETINLHSGRLEMEVLIVNQKEVRQFLPMGECMDIMADVLKTLSQENALNPLRWAMWLPDRRGLLGMMPGYLGDSEIMGLKAVSVFPANHAIEHDSHQGTVLIFETKNGRLLAIVDASEITAIRTAAVSGVATKLLANNNAADLAILGSGVQARSHLEAMLVARKITRVRVWSRSQEHAERFAERESKQHDLRVDPMSTVQGAVQGAEIICTTTSATEPILNGDWIASGAHINAVGSSVAFARELDTAAVARSRLFVDRRESTINEAGDFLFAKKEGAIDDDHILAELGEILLGKSEGRETRAEVTLFKSLGLAVEDIASAHHIYKKMREAGKGRWLEIGGMKPV
ncbi:MAG: ornithine cyclodeaminase family protein [bacterium]